MLISDDSRRLLRDLATASVVAGTLALIVSPDDPSMASAPVHAAWLIALVLAARYGARGLYAVPAVAIGVQLAVWISGAAELTMLERLSRPEELAMLATIAGIASVGAMNATRTANLEARLCMAQDRATTAEQAVGALSETSLALRDRCDRSQTSLAVLTDLAVQIESADPTRAGDAALALAMVRTGARGGFVQLFEGGRLQTLCSRGTWSAERATPPAVFRDIVVLAAMGRSRAVAAHDLRRVFPNDSDLAAPLVDASGSLRGVLALRGIPTTTLGAAAREDLAVIGRWAGRAFGTQRATTGTGPAAEARAVP